MRRLVLSVVVLGLFALPVWAQTNKALEIVPDDALGFVLIKDLRQLYDKVEDLAAKTNGKAQFAYLDLILSKELKKGLNEKGSAVVIVMAGKDEKTIPCPILALPAGDNAVLMQVLGVKEEAKDGISMGSVDVPLLARFWFEPKQKAKDAKEPVGPKMPVLVAKRDGFVLLTAFESKDQLQRVLSAKKSIASIVEPAKTWLDEQDICGTVTAAGMKIGFPLMLIGPEGQPFGKDFAKNVKLIAFGARIEKEGHARLLTRAFFTDDSPYAKRTGKAEPVQTTLFSSLSDERYIFAALARISPEANFEILIAEHHHQKLPAAKAKELTDASVRLLRRISEVGMSVNADRKDDKENNKGFDATAVVFLKVDDASTFVEGATDLMKKHSEATNAVADTLTDVKFEPMRVADKQSVLITITERKKDAKSDKEPAPRPADILIMTVLDPQTLLVGTLKKADQAESFVKANLTKPAKSLEANDELKKTFSMLPKQTQLAAFINLKTIFGGETPGLKDCPPLGFSVSMLPGSIEAQFVLPFETLQALVAAENARSKKEPEKK
jgi:hypothetical protein